MCKGGDPLLLVRFQPEVNGNRNKSDPDEDDTDQITQGKTSYEKQREEHRCPNDYFAEIRLHEDEKAGCRGNCSTEQQPKHGMHLAELS